VCGDKEAADEYEEAYGRAYRRVNMDVGEGGLWNGEYYCQIWRDGSVNNRLLQDQTVGILFGVVPDDRAQKIIGALNARSMTPYGVAETFPYYDESFGYLPAVYHNGAVWPWVSFMGESEDGTQGGGDRAGETGRESRPRGLGRLVAQRAHQ